MLSLLFATICSASIALLFKWSDQRNLSKSLQTTGNYAMATLISGVIILWGGQINAVDLASVDFTNTVMLGVITGVFFLLSFVFYQLSVKKSGASLSGMFAKLGILVPMLLSVIIWSELPSWIQTIGILFAMFAIVLTNIDFNRKDKNQNRSFSVLILLFIFGGFGEFMNKIFQRTVQLDYKPYFLLFVFATAGLLSVILYLRDSNKPKLKWPSLLMGFVIGIPNLFSSFFLLDALNDFPASIVFPMYSAGSILLITLLSWALFKEKIAMKDKMAILLTAVGLMLINS